MIAAFVCVLVCLALAVGLARLSTFLALPSSQRKDRRLKNWRALAGGFACLLMIGLMLAPTAAFGQYTPQSKVYTYTGITTVPAQTFTAASQTGTAITLIGANSGTINLIGTSLTTATWQIQGSVDGTNYFVLNVSTYNGCYPGTCTVATSTTSTASGLYRVNLAGLRYVKFLTTSATFTGTSISLQLNYSDAKGTL